MKNTGRIHGHRKEHGMQTSTYTLEEERQINSCLKMILNLLDIQIPEDHFGVVELSFPRQNGKIAGEVEVKLRSRHRREQKGRVDFTL